MTLDYNYFTVTLNAGEILKKILIAAIMLFSHCEYGNSKSLDAFCAAAVLSKSTFCTIQMCFRTKADKPVTKTVNLRKTTLKFKSNSDRQ